MSVRFFFIALLLIQPAGGQDYLWPTDAGRVLTSSFAESRENRFHAGIDVKTWGRTGYKVFAVRSGYLSRIQVSPFGYGRVLYQTLDTGETAVYGHLSQFAPAVQEVVERKQEARGRYSITLFPDQDQFPVKKGDLIGYTGESGVGHPHLHFELRDKASRPINPFARGYVVHDKAAPIVRKISVTPLSADSRVQGDLRPWVVQPRRVSPGRYQVEEPIRVKGMIAFGLDAFDQM
ncbi:M23 family metallopeptidase, partial [bacterium]|nr:M23 family metallopeptidase [bacterium]